MQLDLLLGVKKCDLCDELRKSLIKVPLNKSHLAKKSVIQV